MTLVGKENVARLVKGCGLFDNFAGAEEYLLSLIKDDISKETNSQSENSQTGTNSYRQV